MTETLVPAGLAATDWMVCSGCRQFVYRKRLARNLWVCPDCGRHHRLTAGQRLAQLLDEGTEDRLEFEVAGTDPLAFIDTEPYPRRWQAAREATGLAEAVLVAKGRVMGAPVVLAVMDFRFLGGSLGSAVGELVTVAAEIALRERTPLLLVTASGGARMQEGALSLMQMAKTARAMGELDKAGIPTISLITDPTFGGVAASFATLADVIIAEPGARMGFAGRRVIEQTVRQVLPEGFQTAEFLLAHGLIDAIRPRHALRVTLGRLLSAKSGIEPPGPGEPDPVLRDPAGLPAVPAWDRVLTARDPERPTTVDYLSLVFDEFERLDGDRISGDCPAMIGGVARLAGIPVMVLGQQKGHTLAERAAHNHGMPSPAGYRKAARLAGIAAKLGLPVITLVDTPGAYPGVEAEEQGQFVAIAECIRLFAELPVPVVSVITGEGGSGGALATAVADRVLICANGIYSVISPEGCAAILWHDAQAARAAAGALRLGAPELLALGVVDGIVPEPDGGTQADHLAAARMLRAALLAALGELFPMNPAELIGRRGRKFRRLGAGAVQPVESGTG
ncbi:acetyl-CoA carboxylase, carboxyltransferase subunit beta [Amycolatopsis sp. MJM2582]|uniref:acetyl-CoA carboxylase, carboxyltransferase subunit beta n=1 Tax=Amycolatopsis sp. MJM2582 TaxID=1427749 RepID=UPI000A97FF2F|nr:acetyl-CoA carboxylase, carboxyltransferase subunit beta [Amycolatopsis sp. MJM2582]